MDKETVSESASAGPAAGDDGQTRNSIERMVLAGIGVVATALDTAEERFDQYVERGAQIREELQEKRDGVRRQNWDARNRARDYFRNMMDLVLDAFNVPSGTDVDTINVKLNILTRKLDDLQMQTSESPSAPEPPIKGDTAP
jgi:polyhydroxyalkanoate synthesis regulator phasin